jgi:ATP-binding cassette subfamily B protein
MSILWQYLRRSRGYLTVAVVLAAASQILDLIDPLIFGKIIDDYALNPERLPAEELVRGVLWWLLAAVAIALGARLARTFQDYTLELVVQTLGMEIFNDGLKQTLRLPFEEYERSSSGETVAMLEKVRRDSERFINSSINVLFSAVVGVAFLVWYAVTKHWILVPVFLVGGAFLGGLTGLLSRKIRILQRQIFRRTATTYGSITESLRNIELVKSLGLARAERKRLQEYTRQIFDLEMKKIREVRTLSFVQRTIINLLKQSILFILLWLIFRDVLSPGELISAQLILNTIFVPLQQLGMFILAYREAQASIQNFSELMAKPTEQRPEEPVDIGELESLRFDDVVFRYRTATENAIDHISFRARLGDTIAFVGPSGSGKSTLVKLLVGLYRPVSGTIFIDDVPVSDLSYNRVRRQIGFVTQDPQLFSGTIRDNLRFVKPEATDEEMHLALERAAATGLLARSGEGLDTRLGEGGTRVSGGERQRLAIARALLREPRLFIFDEATSSLDSITEREITRAVREVSRSRDHIVILIAHRLSTISHADTVFVLEKGRVVETGSHDQLLKQLGLYYAMWRTQIGERETPLPPKPTPAAIPSPAPLEETP